MTRGTHTYLQGYYPPSIDAEGDFQAWSARWSMGPHAEKGWVWFEGYYTEEKAREELKNPDKSRICDGDDPQE